MKKCENCNVEHNGTYGSGRFCSSKCARGYSTKEKRVEINIKVSEKLKGKKRIDFQNQINKKRKKVKSRSKFIGYSYDEKWVIINKRRKTQYEDKLLNEEFDKLTFERLRKRVILEQNGKCNNCKNDKWLGYDIMLELEHIDGNNKNNKRKNLEALCPNCHSLTPTWRGRNKKNKREKISDEKLLKSLVENNFNMRQALLEVGLAAKGGNYKRCHKLKREYDEIIK